MTHPPLLAIDLGKNRPYPEHMYIEHQVQESQPIILFEGLDLPSH